MQGYQYLATHSLQLQPERKYGEARLVIMLNKNIDSAEYKLKHKLIHKNSSSLLYLLTVSVIMVLKVINSSLINLALARVMEAL